MKKIKKTWLISIYKLKMKMKIKMKVNNLFETMIFAPVNRVISEIACPPDPRIIPMKASGTAMVMVVVADNVSVKLNGV